MCGPEKAGFALVFAKLSRIHDSHLSMSFSAE